VLWWKSSQFPEINITFLYVSLNERRVRYKILSLKMESGCIIETQFTAYQTIVSHLRKRLVLNAPIAVTIVWNVSRVDL
jgi:hypothetical protein